MNEIQVFTNDQFGQIRTIEQDGEPWFVAADVCKALEIGNVSDAMRRLDDDEKMTLDLTDSHSGSRGGAQMIGIVNEPGIYSLVLGSRKPEAKAFKRWITHEVIPTIRKHGAYATEAVMDRILEDPDYGIKLLNQLKQERQKNQRLTAENAMQTQKIAEMNPKVSYYDIVLQCKTLIKTSVIAKDYGMAAKAFNKLLKKLDVQYKQGDIWLLYSKYQNKGYTSTKTNTYDNWITGEIGAKPWMYWTQKGRLFLYDLLKQNGILPLIERDDERCD